MAFILATNGIKPTFGKDCWMAPNATIVGDVITGDECTFWFNAVVRGDVNAIRMGNRVNVQDGAVIHCTYQKSQTIIGDFVSIAHNAIVHGCTIHDRVLVGMGAIVMDGAVIGSDSIIAAGAIVTQNMVIPPRSIYAGNPAKFLKEITPELEAVFMRTANNYVMYSKMYDF